MLDFTSALYLGFWHASRSLRPWKRLTTGVPAALAEPPEARALAAGLAALQGCEGGIMAASTLHLFWDLFGILARERIAIYLDSGAYPISRWGVERAAARGAEVHRFPHRDSVALGRLVRGGIRRPVVVTDGVCTCCGQLAPLAAYLDSVERRGGWLIVDDTQALGIFGAAPGPGAPYGRGGGGSLPHGGIHSPQVILVTSLAKGLGVPLAVLCGSRALVDRFERESETRVHTSPPSIADLHAAERALALNAQQGDTLRLGLAQRVKRFRQRLLQAGLSASGGLFPVQTPRLASDVDVVDVYRKLYQLGVRSVPRQGEKGGQGRISFIINARHRPQEIDRAVQALALALGAQPEAG